MALLAGSWLGLTVTGAAQYSMIDMGELGGGYARWRAINEAGQIAGESLQPVTWFDRAVLWQGGTMVDLGTLGGQESSAFGINSSGTVCGWAQTAAGNGLPALWQGGDVTALPTLGGAAGTAWGINDAGAAVGHSYLATGGHHATLWSDGGVLDLGTLGGSLSVAYDINNGGVAVGTAFDSANRDRAALWGADGIVDLYGLSGGEWIAARAINDLGQVILQGTPQGVADERAVFWNGDPLSPVIDLGTFGGIRSSAWGLNDNGFVVGRAEDPNGHYRAFVWNGDEMTDLGTLGGFYSSAYGINGQGIIVGFATDALARTHAVEWVPVPEPAVLLLGLLGGGMVGLWTRCRKPPSRTRH